MKQTLFLLTCMLCAATLSQAQVNYTANNQVIPYTGKFRMGINQGYYPNWSNQQMADISAGNPAVNQKGIGAKANRAGLYEIVLDYYGYNLNVPDFQHYTALGMGEHVAIVGGPSGPHHDFSAFYCPGVFSNMFGNLYTPIWDGGANGTPYNDNNYFAAYLYKVVSQYKDDVRFWEIWNEPGLDLNPNGIGWRDQNYPGNWWLEGPNPCDNILHAPLYHYTRTLRIAWEIIKTVDPDSYVCLGSVGYQSYLNALLRNTDNPNNGDVSPDYPLGGGAYFDCISYHTYPHFDGSTRNQDAGYYERHSDEAANGLVKYRDYYQQILNQYGYDGVTYPKKEWIITEINSPRKSFYNGGNINDENFAGYDAQINHMMKAFMTAKVNKIHQLHPYELFDQKTEAEAGYEFHLMGLYKNIAGIAPYGNVVNDEGKAMKTMTDLIYNTEYDAVRTAALNLPTNMKGFAWKKPDGSYIYAIWAKTNIDLSESASATYSFPAALGLTNLTKYVWDYGYTGFTLTVGSQNLQLDARPVFFTASTGVVNCSLTASASNVLCNNNGTPNNPADDTFTFTMTVNGNNTSGSWQTIIHGATVIGTIGTPKSVGPYPISGGNLTLVIRDAASSTCTTELGINAPLPCSTGGGTGTYCAGKSDFPWEDWIAKVKIGTINKTSSKTPYSDFTSENTALAAGSSNPITLTTGFSWNTYPEFWRVWIDFNKNGTFEPTEKVFEGTQPAGAPGTPTVDLNGNLSIPAGSAQGSTRMRVSMKRGAYADPCETLPFGEVEDYSVNITGGGGGPVCAISAAVSNILCNDNGTPAVSTDDTFTFSVTVSGSNTGAGWATTVNGTNISGTYGTAKAFGPYPVSGGSMTLTIQDNTTATCTTSATATAPPACSTGGGATCANNLLQNPGFENNLTNWEGGGEVGTVAHSGSKALKVCTNGVSVRQTIAALPNKSYTLQLFAKRDAGTNGVVVFKFMNNAYTPIQTDFIAVNSTNYAQLTKTVTSPANTARVEIALLKDNGTGCLYADDWCLSESSGGGTVCSINAAVSNVLCNDNGTPTNTADDKFSFSLLVTGSNAGSGWTANINGQIVTGQYGTVKNLGPYNIAAGNLAFQVADNTTATCTANVAVTAPSACSNGGGPVPYCNSKSDYPWHDWIGNVTLGSINNNSGKSLYSDFTGFSTTLARGQATTIALTANFSWFTYNEYWKVWIDYNHNGVFEEPNEVAYETMLPKPVDGTAALQLTGNILVPLTALPGNTRMRVSMKRGAYATPCETLPFGEVEDYTVNILSNQILAAPAERAILSDGEHVFFFDASKQANGIQLNWADYNDAEISRFEVQKSVDGLHWSVLTEIAARSSRPGIQSYAYLDTKLAEGANFYRIKTYNTQSQDYITGVKRLDIQIPIEFGIIPNPAKDRITLDITGYTGRLALLCIYNAQGTKMDEVQINETDGPFLEIPLLNYVSGQYFLQLTTSGKRPLVKKLMIESGK